MSADWREPLAWLHEHLSDGLIDIASGAAGPRSSPPSPVCPTYTMVAGLGVDTKLSASTLADDKEARAASGAWRVGAV